MEATHTRFARNGKPDDVDSYGKPVGYNEIGNISHYIFWCDDCGHNKRFTSTQGRNPKYIESAILILFP